MMPIMDGFTLAKKIRSENQQVPIIFLTAKAMKEDKLEGFKAGGDDYLTKPFSMEELQMRIDAVLRRCLPNNDEPEVDEYEVGIYKFNHIFSFIEITCFWRLILNVELSEYVRTNLRVWEFVLYCRFTKLKVMNGATNK